MAKKNKNKSSIVEGRRKNRKSNVPLVKRNPFEVRVSRVKHQVLGQKVKTDRGVPGVSRSKANEKRKKTLLNEYKQRFKNNAIIDRRFGEFDENLSIEEKMLKRYALEKQRHHEKADMYRLDDDDDDILTHYGQNIGDIDNFDDAGLKFTDDEEEDGGEDHFGGFLKKKKKSREDDDAGFLQVSERKLTKQEIMDQVVANSKKKKLERQQTQERAFELTQQIDSQFKDILPLLIKKTNENTKHIEADDYDRTVNELFFESKAKANDRMKTDEEIAREEKQKLEELERQRRLRMLGEEEGDDDNDEMTNEQSADALLLKRVKHSDTRMEIHYRDGKAVLPDGVSSLLKKEEMKDNENSDDSDVGGDENETVEDEIEASSDDEGEDSEHEDIFSDDDDNDKGQNDGNSRSGNEEDAEKIGDNCTKITSKKNKTRDQNKGTKKIRELSSEKNQEMTKNKRKEVTKDEALPYVFEAPTCLEEFLEIVSDRSDEQILTILNRIRKCHHVKLGEENRGKIQTLFDVLLSFIEHLCCLPKPKLKLVNNLAEFLNDLVEDIPDHVTKTVLKKLKTMYKKVALRMKLKGSNGVFPTLSEMIFLKVISILYPTSDLNHAVTTPSLVLMAMVYSKSHCVTIGDVLSGLFLLNITYDYIKLSKRYIPEVVSFIGKLLYFAAQTNADIKKISASILNVRREEHSFLLVEKITDEKPTPINLASCLSSQCDPLSLNNEQFKLSCVRNLLLTTKKFCTLYKDLSTFNEIFQPCALLIDRLPHQFYPKTLKKLRGEVHEEFLSKVDIERIPLTMQARKPIPLPLLEPQFDEHFEYRSKSRGGDKQQNEEKKLKYKVKKETKGAMREIRKDAHFLAKEQLKEKVKKDHMRKEKVKQLQRTIENERREIKEMEKAGGI